MLRSALGRVSKHARPHCSQFLHNLADRRLLASCSCAGIVDSAGAGMTKEGGWQSHELLDQGAHGVPHPASRSNCRIRCGVIGISKIPTPNGASASETALSIAAGAPIVPPSPTPLAPVTLDSVRVSR